jgi:hypothetical protein
MLELVATRMAAELVVVVHDQDARIPAEALAVVMSRGQAADSGADDDAVVFLIDR